MSPDRPAEPGPPWQGADLQPLQPDLAAIRRLVLDAVSSPTTKKMYAKALDDFFAWWAGQGRPAFARASVQAHRAWLEEQGYSPSTINQRLAALRKLAREAALNGHLASEAAAGVTQVPGLKQRGARAGNWLTREQAQLLLDRPDPGTLKGLRDRAILALLLGCGLRRAEATGLDVNSMEQRDGRWVIPDLRGKHGRLRTVPVPGWVKHTVDLWVQAAGLATGRLLRSMNRHGHLSGDSLSPNAILSLVSAYGAQLGVKLQAHDTRRTCAKLCRAAGGELEQIQLLLGHASILTTERYLGTRQNLADAPNDHMGLTAARGATATL
ncbi:tyrosine-type recombinase/integrase [Paludibaculum fermentans]|uniref:Tyrosine-type recombinase/integrase n=1 Tax=Paludibaculum fermentans TaxID=1473598 RepID=A0A7S7NZV0_PALFE|nr:tyrosine-type recombinase/integrase [Paludibaculum fermentans]QOY92324.1 tyrosine-type recombinase/integrase [Paludibaculum fermentans]